MQVLNTRRSQQQQKKKINIMIIIKMRSRGIKNTFAMELKEETEILNNTTTKSLLADNNTSTEQNQNVFVFGI